MRWLLCCQWDNVVGVPLPEVFGGGEGVKVTVVHFINVEVQQLQGRGMECVWEREGDMGASKSG